MLQLLVQQCSPGTPLLPKIPDLRFQISHLYLAWRCRSAHQAHKISNHVSGIAAITIIFTFGRGRLKMLATYNAATAKTKETKPHLPIPSFARVTRGKFRHPLCTSILQPLQSLERSSTNPNPDAGRRDIAACQVDMTRNPEPSDLITNTKLRLNHFYNV